MLSKPFEQAQLSALYTFTHTHWYAHILNKHVHVLMRWHVPSHAHAENTQTHSHIADWQASRFPIIPTDLSNQSYLESC